MENYFYHIKCMAYSVVCSVLHFYVLAKCTVFIPLEPGATELQHTRPDRACL